MCEQGTLGPLLGTKDYVIMTAEEAAKNVTPPATPTGNDTSTTVAPETDLDVSVGGSVVVKCKETWQLFFEDKWDADPTDNRLTIICKPDSKFNVPIVKLPPCWAKCDKNKPAPLPADKLALNTNLTSATDYVWQGEKIWYKCTDSGDGLEVMGPDDEMEGSNDQEIAYECGANSQYTVPDTGFRRCLPRRKGANSFSSIESSLVF